MQQARPHSLLLAAPLLLGLAGAFTAPLPAQQTKTITILIYDGKTGRPLIPDNYVIRIDHLDAVHNEWLTLKDDGTGIVTVPSGATFLGVQGAYHKSLDLYINCDAAMEKDTSTLHWYSVPDIPPPVSPPPTSATKANTLTPPTSRPSPDNSSSSSAPLDPSKHLPTRAPTL